MSVSTNRHQITTRSLVRSDSSCGSLLLGPIEEKISRTFSLSSSESDDDSNNEVLGERFVDEDVSDGGKLKYALDTMTSARANDGNALVPRSLPELRVPLEIYPHSNTYHKNTASSRPFLMESMVRRDETKTRFVLYHQSREAAQPIFCAEKYPPADGGQILIKSVVGNDRDIPILGSLMKQRKKRVNGRNGNVTRTTTYELIVHKAATPTVAEPSSSAEFNNNRRMFLKKKKEPLVVATIEYEQISRARCFLEGGRPRCARVRIFQRDRDSKSGTIALNDRDTDNDRWVEVETKEASVLRNGQKVLDFGGRGRETSSKNTQLVRSSVSENDDDDFGGVVGDGSRSFQYRWTCLQMVKWKTNEFNLDFGPPFDAFHAFAFALAQFDF